MSITLRGIFSLLTIFSLSLATLRAAGDLSEEEIGQIVDTYVGNCYRLGQATAFSVGITLNGRTYFRSYGYKSYGDTSEENETDEHSIYEIGSVTKIWTTALAGQQIVNGTLSLQSTLGDFSGALPDLYPQMKNVTIGELASFTAGLPDVGNTDGHGSRPSINDWGVSPFVRAISLLVPSDYTKKVPLPCNLPAPYFYSDWSTGLLGLLIANPNAPLPASAVTNWADLVESNIEEPLGMTDSYIIDTDLPEQLSNVVRGYVMVTASVSVVNLGIDKVALLSSGGGYTTAPTVTISQPGGGTGATARAVLDRGTVKKIEVTNRGRGYLPSPEVKFQGGGGNGAVGQAIVINGELVGVQITRGGSGYKTAPAVQLKVPGNGQGSGAAGVAQISNGVVIGVTMTSTGSGYAAPPTVFVSPPDNTVNVVPVWAAAGAIKSSASDLIKLCQVYLGQENVNGNDVPRSLTQGAQFALNPLAQNGVPTTVFTGMAWQVDTGDIQGGLNARISKDGGLPGFATYVQLVPAIKLGVVILRSNQQSTNQEYEDPIGDVASAISRAIQNKLIPVN